MAGSPVSAPAPPRPSPSPDTLEVFAVPIGREGYELFCERQSDEDGAAAEGGESTGVWGRLVARFGIMLRAAEDREAQGDAAPAASEGMWARLQGRMLAWVAERVAEQRLLWRLRGTTTVRLNHPDDVSVEVLLPIAKRLLQSDFERHRRWLVVDAVVLAVSGVLAIVPGPNVLAYFFAFRVVGHWLSMRGASQGIHVASWHGVACPPLTSLRGVATLSSRERAVRAQRVAGDLGLERLPRFIERLASRR